MGGRVGERAGADSARAEIERAGRYFRRSLKAMPSANSRSISASL